MAGKAAILLHEIYGKNRFMEEQCRRFESLGFHVYCPDFYRRAAFAYEETEAAYAYFYTHVGLDAYRAVWDLVDELKEQYDEICLIGFSVGAALAWRCSVHPGCTGVVAFYGSRIRDYLDVRPRCPVLLLFAERDSFDVASVVKALEHTRGVQTERFQAEHGFYDPYGLHYDALQAEAAEQNMMRFFGQ